MSSQPAAWQSSLRRRELPLSPRNRELETLARAQLFVLDLRPADAPALIAAQLGGNEPKTAVVWRDAESELVVYPGETRVRLAPGFVIIELHVASDQTGRDILVIPFRVGGSPNEAVATAFTETVPRGNALLAARWGPVATTITWHALLRAGQALLARRRLKQPMAIGGVYTLGAVLSFLVTLPVNAEDVTTYFTGTLETDVVPDLSVLNRRYLGSLPVSRAKIR